MVSSFYKNFILSNPIRVLFLVALIVSVFSVGATKLKIDASSDTILLENDSDLLFAKEVATNFKTPNILVVAFSPNSPLLSKQSQITIKKMSLQLESLENIESITSILNVPLLQSSNKPIKEIISDIPTLSNSQLDIDLVKKEFLNSPIYKNSLVSSDFKTTAIILNLKEEQSSSQQQKDELREKNHIFIKDIRAILKTHQNSGKLFLGGVNMISDDLISFVKNDLFVFGSALLLLLVVVLWATFREIRWVILPVIISASSIIATSGLLGFFGWEVTVISSNFISLQLIITLAIVLHLIVRYRELVHICPNCTQKNLVLETVMSKLSPSFFAILTTIVGFASLMFSNILPIINLGWMMSSGIAISLVLSFIIFPAILVMLPKSKKDIKNTKKFSSTTTMANWVEFHGNAILFTSLLVAVFSLTGATKLIVENSFINYFRSSTEIYKGMQVIDEQLGGTTPLDVIVKFKKLEDKVEHYSNDEFDDFQRNFSSDDETAFSSFDDEFEKEDEKNQYWFTPDKMQLILEIHNYLESRPEIGNVQSLATLQKLGKSLNEGKDLDNFGLALIYNKLPEEFKQIILNPYLNIENNEVRFATRIVDSNPQLRRNQLIKEINSDLEKMIDPETASFRQSNLMILYNNMLQSLFESQIVTLGFVLMLLFVMFLLIFRSFKVALIAIISNAISISVIFGFMGWFNIPLDLMTITIAAISLGIGVDDTIHYIHRFYEELEKDGDFVKAMHRSHNSVGYAMYYTTFAIMLGFSILILSNFVPTIYFGFLTMVAMIMALLGALLLLPRLLLIFKPRL
ncbi:MAG TPA: RND family transporter [Sulfurospirillum arcachonense]|nr:RND family transporter [Sulfurospirillum arcachonense]HIP44227.1 RND family transporter [Sulfurospirillum arcachonense]